MSTPTVSIILPVFNRAATLERCVGSVVAQTFKDWELIAVDDASRDGSIAMVQSFPDPRIRVLRHTQNRGAGAARDTAIKAAQGRWLALLDSDDEWLPEKLAEQLAAVDREPQHTLCSCNYLFFRARLAWTWPKRPSDSLERTLHRECTFGFGSTLMIRADVARALGGFDPELPRHEDWDWVLRAVQAGETLQVLPETLARVFAIEPPRVQVFAQSTERFLAKYDAAFRAHGEAYRQQIVVQHFESIASMAYEQRRYLLGHRYLLKAFAAGSRRSRLALAALPLGVVDWVLHTRFIQWGAALRRAWVENDPPTRPVARP